MVKCSLYQCRNCKTVFLARWYVWGYDGPFVIERYYDEHNMDAEKCPDCSSSNLDFIGKTHITRKQRKLLITNYDEAKAQHLYYFSAPKLVLLNQTHFI